MTTVIECRSENERHMSGVAVSPITTYFRERSAMARDVHNFLEEAD